jgi:hypothetical protein
MYIILYSNITVNKLKNIAQPQTLFSLHYRAVRRDTEKEDG